MLVLKGAQVVTRARQSFDKKMAVAAFTGMAYKAVKASLTRFKTGDA
jgi:hypothetical protein